MSNRLDIAAGRHGLPEHLRRKWDDACNRYLPLIDDDSIWRYNRPGNESDLDQGWKLHISATILNAPAILNRIAPVLREGGVQFKAPRSLNDVLKLNSGLLGSYSQVGKIITVYPRHDGELVKLARVLHQLTYRFRAPAVPFDLRYYPTSNIYYRYGAFRKRKLERDGSVSPAMISARGELVPDVRENAKPEWVCDPFQDLRATATGRKRNALKMNNSFRVLRALVQRGKGGVYQAIDFQSTPPRVCLLKEGRRYGEINWNGQDGAWLVRHEQRVLSRLSRCGIEVPKVYSAFEVEGNVYLAMEFIEGQSLHSLLLRQKRKLPVRTILSFGIDIATLLAQMHRVGWAWRDCKPSNLIVNAQGRLVPIDFEGATSAQQRERVVWGTPGFIQRTSSGVEHTGLSADLYGLGSVLFLLITGQMFDDERPIPIERLRRRVPASLRALVESLLDAEPQRRPSAGQARFQLTTILSGCSVELPQRPDAKAA